MPIVEQVIRIFDEKALSAALQKAIKNSEDVMLTKIIAIRLATHYKNVDAVMWLARYEFKANNMPRAKEWFKVAADAGNAEAIKALEAYDTLAKI